MRLRLTRPCCWAVTISLCLSWTFAKFPFARTVPWALLDDLKVIMNSRREGRCSRQRAVRQRGSVNASRRPPKILLRLGDTFHPGGGLQEIAVPELEDQQMPEFPGAITYTAPVLLQSLLHATFAEVAALNGFGLEQNFEQRRYRFLPEPVHQRHGETFFRAVDDFARDTKSFSQLFQDVLRSAGPEFPARR